MAKKAETTLQFYLGIDPGRDKTGVALVEETGRILAVQVMRTRNFSDALLQFLYETLQVRNTWGLRKILKAVVLGNGTGSEEHKQWVEKALPGYPVYIVDEKYSTEEAKALYWKLYPPHGLRRLIPLGLQIPPEPLDGYAAVVQVHRFMEQEGTGQDDG
ncbi:MAG: pre-16S rRNA-processing nuclease YqgF [Acidaminococcaceae bacterium]|jgi:RNase H-fold protein (predicted Holliday junction resolvase)|nr:pre-16S rRNA-processing nuclease YqgF [Acidaminococcaceae bacterium]